MKTWFNFPGKVLIILMILLSDANLDSWCTSGGTELNGKINMILGSLLGVTTLLLAASTVVLICFITANTRLKKKLKQFARSHSRYSTYDFYAKQELLMHHPDMQLLGTLITLISKIHA